MTDSAAATSTSGKAGSSTKRATNELTVQKFNQTSTSISGTAEGLRISLKELEADLKKDTAGQKEYQTYLKTQELRKAELQKKVRGRPVAMQLRHARIDRACMHAAAHGGRRRLCRSAHVGILMHACKRHDAIVRTCRVSCGCVLGKAHSRSHAGLVTADSKQQATAREGTVVPLQTAGTPCTSHLPYYPCPV